MMRLPTLTARKLVAALKQAGFEEVKWRGSHLYLAHPARDLETCVPMHGGDLGRDLVRAIIHQAGLTEEEFRKLL
jgi:predicted RNA binding protein YcfA (HicA-like mRNA interferase family)